MTEQKTLRHGGLGLALDQRKAATMNASTPCLLPGDLSHRFASPVVVESLPFEGPLTRAVFFHLVAMLGGDVGRSATGDVAIVRLVCPYGAWRHNFGELRCIQEYRAAASRSSIEVWEQPCSDGTVHCVGNLVDDLHEGQFVVLMRVCDF
jgi:hypothetical protein